MFSDQQLKAAPNSSRSALSERIFARNGLGNNVFRCRKQLRLKSSFPPWPPTRRRLSSKAFKRAETHFLQVKLPPSVITFFPVSRVSKALQPERCRILTNFNFNRIRFSLEPENHARSNISRSEAWREDLGTWNRDLTGRKVRSRFVVDAWLQRRRQWKFTSWETYVYTIARQAW